MRIFLFVLIAVGANGAEIRAGGPADPLLDESFRLMYELRFDDARARIG